MKNQLDILKDVKKLIDFELSFPTSAKLQEQEEQAQTKPEEEPKYMPKSTRYLPQREAVWKEEREIFKSMHFRYSPSTVLGSLKLGPELKNGDHEKVEALIDKFIKSKLGLGEERRKGNG